MAKIFLEWMILAGVAINLTAAVQNMTTKIPTTKNMTTKIPTTIFTEFSCPAGEYRCTINNECIDRSWVCDGEKDCDDGQDESKATCDNRCQRLEKPKHGRRIKYKMGKDNKEFTPGVRARFRCKKKYALVGDKLLVCKRGGFWSSDPPICVDKSIKCPKVKNITNGTVEANSEDVGAKVSYKCIKDFKLIGPSKRRCLPTGKWSGDDPKCVAKACRRPKGLRRFKNGKFQITDEHMRVWSNIIFDCDDGYYMSGKADTMTCLAKDEKWHPPRPPRCSRISCGNPGMPKYGRKFGSNFTLGNTIEFYCNTGYKLTGSQARTCQSDGTWSGALTVCDSQEFDCRDPGIPANCRRSGDSFNIGDTVTFECYRDYALRGSDKRTCKGNGTWTGTETFCDSEKIVIIPPLNETIKSFEKNVVENLSPVTCASNKDGKCHFAKVRGRSININHPDGLDLIFLFDSSSSIGQAKFKLGLEFACYVIKQFGVDYSRGGTRVAAITFSSRPSLVYNLGDFEVETTEKACKVTKNIKYSGGGTGTRYGLDLVRERVVPMFDEGTKRALIVIADGKSNFGGSPERISRWLMLTHNVEIFAIGVGRRINKVELKLIATGGKGHIFQIKTYEDFQRLTDAMIEKDYSKCGQGGVARQGRMIGGVASIEREWPWQVAIFRDYKFICGGSLIEKNVIMTAAHCLEAAGNRFNKRITPNAYRIVPGQVKLVFEPGDKEAWLENPAIAYKVDKIYYHQNYIFGGAYKDDIALFTLKKAVKWSPRIRRVCLPKTAHYVKANTWGYVCGWGERKNRKVSSKLIHAIMPIRSNKTCKLEGSQIKEKMFCAGEGLGKNDSCRGDSGGPFVVNLADNVEETEFSWNAVGIVSHGPYPCAQKNEYGKYTRVSNYMKWIKNRLDEIRKT